MNYRIARFIAASALLALSVPARGQQQGPSTAPTVTFQTEVNYVDVDAIVTDAQGNFVGNLTKDDFEVLEDGKPQKVDTVRDGRYSGAAAGPLSRSWIAPSPRDVRIEPRGVSPGGCT